MVKARRDLKRTRKQLIELRIAFFILCLKYLPPGTELTPRNLLKTLLKK